MGSLRGNWRGQGGWRGELEKGDEEGAGNKSWVREFEGKLEGPKELEMGDGG